MKVRRRAPIVFKKKASSTTPAARAPDASPRQPTDEPASPLSPQSGMERSARSSQALIAVDLAVPTRSSLVVKPAPQDRSAVPSTWEDLVVSAQRVSTGFIESKSGRLFVEGEPIAAIRARGNSKVTLVVALDPVVPQAYIGKHLPRPETTETLKTSSGKPKLTLQIPKHKDAPDATPQFLVADSQQRDEIRLDAKREVNYMLETQNPGAPHLILEMEKDDILLSPVGDGDMHDVLTHVAFADPEIRFELGLSMARQLLPELVKTHAKELALIDIKPTNILFQGGKIYFTDFGSARRVFREARSFGTPEYQPLETFSEPHANPRAADVAALGISTMMVATGLSILGPHLRENNYLLLRYQEEIPGQNDLLTEQFVALLADTKFAFARSAPGAEPQTGWREKVIGPLTPRAQGMLEKWEEVHNTSPKLYPVLHWAQHYLPSLRPTAEQFHASLYEGPLHAQTVDPMQVKKVLDGVDSPIRQYIKKTMEELMTPRSLDRLPTRMRRSHSFTVKLGTN